MNLGQMRAGVYARTGLSSSDPQATPTVVDAFVNDAMHLVEAERDWPWLLTKTTFSTVAGTAAYTPPVDWLRTVSLTAAEQRPMERFGVDELEDRWPVTSVRGLPYEWAVDTDQLTLRPIPDAVYVVTHRYVRFEPDLASDTALPLMPAKFHAAICELAAWLALRQDHEEPRALLASQAYDKWLARMQDDTRRASSPGRIRIRPGGFM